MATYIITRLIHGLIVVFIVTLIVFFLIHLLPGDPLLLYLTDEQLAELSEEDIMLIRHDFGLDKPVIMQYWDWLSAVLHGDLKESMFYRMPVSTMIGKALPVTLHLGLLAFILAIVVGIPMGVISAIRRATKLDTALTVLANIGITIPNFWLAFLLIYVFSLKAGVLPVFGYTSPFKDFWLSTKQLILPVFCLSIFGLASAARQSRSSMLEVINQDYIRTAYSKGLRERMVVLKHALKNAIIPVIALKGVSLSHVIGGSVFIETIFNIPGMGRLAVTAVLNQDYMVVQGVTLVIAVVVVIVNLLIDLSYGWVDPRIRYG
jgi:peptide/nickel transport system permease protein